MYTVVLHTSTKQTIWLIDEVPGITELTSIHFKCLKCNKVSTQGYKSDQAPAFTNNGSVDFNSLVDINRLWNVVDTQIFITFEWKLIEKYYYNPSYTWEIFFRYFLQCLNFLQDVKVLNSSMGHFESCLSVHFLMRHKASKYGVFSHIDHFHTVLATLLSMNKLIKTIQNVLHSY